MTRKVFWLASPATSSEDVIRSLQKGKLLRSMLSILRAASRSNPFGIALHATFLTSTTAICYIILLGSALRVSQHDQCLIMAKQWDEEEEEADLIEAVKVRSTPDASINTTELLM